MLVATPFELAESDNKCSSSEEMEEMYPPVSTNFNFHSSSDGDCSYHGSSDDCVPTCGRKKRDCGGCNQRTCVKIVIDGSDVDGSGSSNGDTCSDLEEECLNLNEVLIFCTGDNIPYVDPASYPMCFTCVED